MNYSWSLRIDIQSAQHGLIITWSIIHGRFNPAFNLYYNEHQNQKTSSAGALTILVTSTFTKVTRPMRFPIWLHRIGTKNAMRMTYICTRDVGHQWFRQWRLFLNPSPGKKWTLYEIYFRKIRWHALMSHHSSDEIVHDPHVELNINVVFPDLHAGIIHEHLIGICTGWWSHIHVPAGPRSSLYTIYSWSYRRSEQFMHCCRTNEVDRNAHKARGKFSLWCSWSHFSVAENNCRMKKIKFNSIFYPTQKIHKVYIKHVYRWLSRVVSSSPSDHQNMFQSNFISEPKVFIQRFQCSNSLTEGQIWQNYTDINIGMFICNGNICLVVVILTRLHTHVTSWWYVNTVSGNDMAHVRLQAITRRNDDKALWLLMELLGNRDLMS